MMSIPGTNALGLSLLQIKTMKITAIEPFHISVPYDFGNSAQNAAAVQWPKIYSVAESVCQVQAA